MIDTHAHIYSEKFENDRKAILDRAFEEGVEKIFMPNIDLESITGMLQLADLYPERCIPMMGLHPCYVEHNYKETLDQIRPWFEKRHFVAVGEMGTDLYWDKTKLKQQQDAFREQCKWAIEMDLPIVIHCRESFWETVALINEFPEGSLKGVFHCFSGGMKEADTAIGLGFYLGIGGVATFKNGGLDVVLPHVDLSHIVLETDCPYLAPKPFRGKRNEPAYLSYIAERVAELKEVDLTTVNEHTTQNALKLFQMTA